VKASDYVFIVVASTIAGVTASALAAWLGFYDG
jgi:hypothetical protein